MADEPIPIRAAALPGGRYAISLGTVPRGTLVTKLLPEGVGFYFDYPDGAKGIADLAGVRPLRKDGFGG